MQFTTRTNIYRELFTGILNGCLPGYSTCNSARTLQSRDVFYDASAEIQLVITNTRVARDTFPYNRLELPEIHRILGAKRYYRELLRVSIIPPVINRK